MPYTEKNVINFLIKKLIVDICNNIFYYKDKTNNKYYNMFEIYICSLFIWTGLTYLMSKFINSDTKIVRNFSSICHATSVVIFYTFNLTPEYLFHITFGYYTVDGIVELYYLLKTKRLYSLMMIIHHIFTCIMANQLTDLTDPIMVRYILSIFYLAELSNFPIYLVYHLRATGYNNDLVLKLLTIVEIIVYVILRIILCGIELYEVYMSEKFSYLMLSGSVFVYIMSIAWSYRLFLQLFPKPIVQKKIEKIKKID